VAVGLALDPIKQLTISADLRVAIWRDLQNVTVTLTDPHAPPGTPAQSQSVALDLHNSWAIRAGAELRVCGGHLHLRIGGGYDATPLPASTLGPLLPDAPRMELSAGLGWHERWIALDVGYMAVLLFRRTAQNPDLAAAYETNGHVITLSATIRVAHWGHHVKPQESPELREEPAARGWQP
jgi:long-subunit fatty acid transport protein